MKTSRKLKISTRVKSTQGGKPEDPETNDIFALPETISPSRWGEVERKLVRKKKNAPRPKSRR